MIQIALPEVYQNIEITIINVLGQIVQEEKQENTSKINFALHGSSGVYIVTVINEKGEKASLKVVKE